ncbi:MAG: magnesium/cobalt efflux protein [Caulobacter vibrioides]|uniref:Magnesium/cobalt efflux protein n=1 Tax=Caulobacter vibrioides TaxID=155892 RepID=A0A258DFJ2_CAUVI|nr:MAG: magnesium/cobalt efflux protein [Caulobacter vibrioides]
MPSDGRSPAAPAAPEPSHRRRPRRAGMADILKRWLGGEAANPVADHTSPAAAEAEVDIVDQAEVFQTLRVSDVMTPRADIAALEISTPLSEVVRQFVDVEHSRMPIYRETLDDPVGVIHIKDLMRLMAPPGGDSDNPPTPPWREPVLHRLRREALYVPASMRTADLLLKMRVARIHMALVIDEFGGTDGLVTLEDLIEAVVGEIDDEHDIETEPAIVARPGGLFEADARVPLEELEALLGFVLSPADLEEEIDTVAGLVATLAGRVPQRGEVIVHPDGFEFEVTEADPRRIKRVRIRPPAKPSDGTEASPADDTAA